MWRKSKVIYNQFVNRELKTTTECYLHDSLSLGDVEYQCAEQLKKRIRSGIEMVDSAQKVRFTHVIFHAMQAEDHFYEIKIAEWVDEKKSSYTYLVPAVSPEQAIERMTAFINNSVSVWRVVGIKESDIMAVWHPNSELWQGDWWNRMDRYDDEGKHDRGTAVEESQEDNDEQLELFNEPGVKKARKNWKRVMNKMTREGTKVSVKGPDDDAYRPLN